MGKLGLDTIRHAYEASADLTDLQYHFVNLDSSDQLQQAPAGVRAAVLIEEVEQQGDSASVVLHGKVKLVAGESIDAWDPLTPDSNGEAVTATAATVDTTTSTADQDVAGDAVCAIALEDAASGDVFTAFVVSLLGALV